MNTRTVFVGCERDKSKVARLNFLREIFAARFTPANQIRLRYQDPAVAAGATARSALQAIKFLIL